MLSHVYRNLTTLKKHFIYAIVSKGAAIRQGPRMHGHAAHVHLPPWSLQLPLWWHSFGSEAATAPIPADWAKRARVMSSPPLPSAMRLAGRAHCCGLGPR